tara:strand:+ start:1008 stop:1211 length:204 start_codon:yes stop_codon:yes gene_type:complete
MKPNVDVIKKAGGERLEVSPKKHAFVLPEIDGFRKMVAYSVNSSWTWVHPDFRESDGKNDKKKKQKR